MDAQLALDLEDGLAAAVPSPFPGRIARGPAAPTASRAARRGEMLVALSHALDLAAGQPTGHAVRACWIGQQLGRALGLSMAELGDVHATTLLQDAGASADAAALSGQFLVDDHAFRRARQAVAPGGFARLHFLLRHVGARAGALPRLRALRAAVQDGGEIDCRLAELRAARGAGLARAIALPDAVADAIAALDERWDGGGHPLGLAGVEIPLAARVAQVARCVAVFHARGGAAAAREAVARRAGRWLDPALGAAFAVLARDESFRAGLDADGDELDARVIANEPAASPEPLDDDALDAVAAAFGQVADAKSAYTSGHSVRVALHAERITAELGLAPEQRRWLRRGSLLHDLGKLGVASALLDKPGRLDPWEWAAMQRHTIATEQVLARVPGFGVLARIAGAHREQLDGNGYPRGLDTRHLRLETRILAVADVFDALTTDRAWRPAFGSEAALGLMQGMVGVQLDSDCLAALRASLAAFDRA